MIQRQRPRENRARSVYISEEDAVIDNTEDEVEEQSTNPTSITILLQGGHTRRDTFHPTSNTSMEDIPGFSRRGDGVCLDMNEFRERASQKQRRLLCRMCPNIGRYLTHK